MINTTEFGDLDAGDIYMPLGDISVGRYRQCIRAR